jgi:uncharacterized protein YbcI
MTIEGQADSGADSRSSMTQELSNDMVRLYKELFGRGPTRVRTHFAGPDTIICTLRDSLTKSEKNLADLGEFQRLRDIRTFFQHASERDFRESVERITGRQVEAFVSGIDTKMDVSSEVFYLVPEDG